jgi:hypothetical protein
MNGGRSAVCLGFRRADAISWPVAVLSKCGLDSAANRKYSKRFSAPTL